MNPLRSIALGTLVGTAFYVVVLANHPTFWQLALVIAVNLAAAVLGALTALIL